MGQAICSCGSALRASLRPGGHLPQRDLPVDHVSAEAASLSLACLSSFDPDLGVGLPAGFAISNVSNPKARHRPGKELPKVGCWWLDNFVPSISGCRWRPLLTSIVSMYVGPSAE